MDVSRSETCPRCRYPLPERNARCPECGLPPPGNERGWRYDGKEDLFKIIEDCAPPCLVAGVFISGGIWLTWMTLQIGGAEWLVFITAFVMTAGGVFLAWRYSRRSLNRSVQGVTGFKVMRRKVSYISTVGATVVSIMACALLFRAMAP